MKLSAIIFGPLMVMPICAAAQLSSGYNMYSAPIGFGDNCGFGDQVMLAPGSDRENAATGYAAMQNHNYGDGNVGNGAFSLFTMAPGWNSCGHRNTAVGTYAMNMNVIGTENTGIGHRALFANNNANYNTAFGMEALSSATDNERNTAMGFQSLQNTMMYAVGDGVDNTGFGHSTLLGTTAGAENSAFGVDALRSGIWHKSNSAAGYGALANAQGWENTALGYLALNQSSNGFDNTAAGASAMVNNTTGGHNAAHGSGALFSNTTGNYNSALGYQALYYSNGDYNTACGMNCLYKTTTGSANTGVGAIALNHNTTGTWNTALGFACGWLNDASVNDDNYNTYIGNYTRINHANSQGNITLIGHWATMANANQNAVRFGDVGVTSVETQAKWLVNSDGRYKYDVSEDDVKGLDFIRRLRPVVYNFDTKKLAETLAAGIPDSLKQLYLGRDFSASMAVRQSGFIAQEVEQAAIASGYNFDGVSKPKGEGTYYGLAYGLFVVPLVKAVQEQQKGLETEAQKIGSLRDKVTALESRLQQMTPASDNNVYVRFTGNGQVAYSTACGPDNCYLGIYDASGKEIAKERLGSATGTVDLSARRLSAGSYIGALVSGSKILVAERIVVQ